MSKQVIGVGVGALVLNPQNQILLGKRHGDPNKADSLLNGAGTRTMPGGKLDFGESFEEGAIRETLEETGITINNPQIFCVSNDLVETAHFATIGLICKNCTEQPRTMEPDKIIEWDWFDLDNLPSPLYFPSKRSIENYKQQKFYIDRS